MYYEDTDLAWRGRARGWRYRYVPDAVLRHVHAATSVEGSPLFQHYVERNRLLMLTKNAPAATRPGPPGGSCCSTASYARPRRRCARVLGGHRPSPGARAGAAALVRRATCGCCPGTWPSAGASAPASVVHDEAIIGWAVAR